MITDYINLFLYKHIFFYRYIVDFAWPLGEILSIAVLIFLIKVKKLTGKKIALVAFFLLTVMLFCNVMGLDTMAGMIGEYVFILFVISFIVEFYNFLKHENK